MEDFGIIIEDKRTDSVTLEKKEETWVMLAVGALQWLNWH
jgi:hypothetical protein